MSRIYKVVFTKKAEKEVRKLQNHIQIKIRRKLTLLSNNFSFTNEVERLNGEYRDAYRLRVGNYRAIFVVQNDRMIIFVVKVAHRKEAYKFQIF